MIGTAAAFSGALWQGAAAAAPGRSPYGDLRPADANGLRLPAGFRSRVIARSRQPVAGYVWHDAPDGGACFPDGTGWLYVSNSEVLHTGGVSAVRFRADGTITGAYRILSGTDMNCAGGATPWGTWLSCEEVPHGQVYETWPRGDRTAVARPRMGRFKHEAAACDPDRKVVYLTEDEPDGCFYRFTPDTWGDLSAGRLEVLCGTNDRVTWQPATNRHQVSAARHFNGGEGCYYAGGVCWFTTKGDNRVWAYDAAARRLSLAYDSGGTLNGVDNLTGTRSGDLYVAEDGGNMEINLITPSGVVAPFLRVLGQSASELTGPAFSPAGDRLYFSSQRGTDGRGITYEVRGPFRS